PPLSPVPVPATAEGGEQETCGCCVAGGVVDGGGGGDDRARPGSFGYSLGKPFHGQRVAAAKFVTFGGGTGDQKSGRRSGLRLVTGGEDGTIKLLDVFYGRHRRHAGGDTPPPVAAAAAAAAACDHLDSTRGNTGDNNHHPLP
ncbi:unnamed protein product, partial [Ectocarpus fasciculatus]